MLIFTCAANTRLLGVGREASSARRGKIERVKVAIVPCRRLQDNWDGRANGTKSKHGNQIGEQTYTRYISLHGRAMGFLPASSVPGMLGAILSE